MSLGFDSSQSRTGTIFVNSVIASEMLRWVLYTITKKLNLTNKTLHLYTVYVSATYQIATV